jgi:DNA-binding NarL/FixJ family response regulator
MIAAPQKLLAHGSASGHDSYPVHQDGPIEPIRVLVADSCSATRSGLRLALEAAGCSVCAEAADAPAAVEAALRERPQVCLLDTALSGDSIAAAAAIHNNVPDAPVIMFGHPPSDAELFAALDAGASGYLTRDMDPDRLAIALRRVSAGEAAFSRTLVARLIHEFRRRRLPLLRDLTNREFEVLELLCLGLRTAEIADRLFVARVTVRTHIASILRKLGVPDRRSAIRLFDEC